MSGHCKLKCVVLAYFTWNRRLFCELVYKKNGLILCGHLRQLLEWPEPLIVSNSLCSFRFFRALITVFIHVLLWLVVRHSIILQQSFSDLMDQSWPAPEIRFIQTEKVSRHNLVKLWILFVNWSLTEWRRLDFFDWTHNRPWSSGWWNQAVMSRPSLNSYPFND